MNKNSYKQMMNQAVPSDDLIQKTKYKMKKEKPIMIKRSFKTAIIAAALVMLLATAAFAAWHLLTPPLTPSEVADELDNQKLSAAFSGENAININASQTARGYTFTLMSIVSGNDISDQYIRQNGQIRNDCTYAVVAIQKTDGSPMLDDFDSNDDIFYISPYLEGYNPWLINAHNLRGGATEIIIDGVRYYLFETDDISIFAHKKVYVGIHHGRTPPHANGAFILDELTEEIIPNPAYDGIKVLFDLPIDKALADPEKARAFLDDILGYE